MKDQDVVVGMKVVPFQKTPKYWGGLGSSNNWRNAKENNQPFLFVVGFSKKFPRAWILSYESNKKTKEGDFFRAKDFNLYL